MKLRTTTTLIDSIKNWHILYAPYKKEYLWSHKSPNVYKQNVKQPKKNYLAKTKIWHNSKEFRILFQTPKKSLFDPDQHSDPAIQPYTIFSPNIYIYNAMNNKA